MEYRWKPTERQCQALDSLDKPVDSELCYGGAKGGGKSFFLCHWVLKQCHDIIAHCGIDKPLEHPIPVGFIGRKVAADFRKTTLDTWKKTIPSEFYEIKGNPSEIIIDGKLLIYTGGLDRSEDVNKFNSAEFMFFAIDQAEETSMDDISVLRGSLRGKINGKHLPYKALWTANPAQCWLKEEFIDGDIEDYDYVPALPTDNPYLPEGYINTLKKAFKHRPELLAAYLEGSWDVFEGHDQVIKNAWVTASKNNVFHSGDNKVLLSCDPAKFGDDETVIYLFSNTKVKEELIYGQKDTMYTANRLAVMSRENGNCPVAIDPIGVGEGISDRLNELGIDVIEVRNSEKAEDTDQHYNRRAEVWDYSSKQFSEGFIEYNHTDRQLVSQLCTPKYKFKNSKILIEPKDEIKKRIGRSPDRADAYVNGIWALQFVESQEGSALDENHDMFYSESGSAMAI